jgi:hypothetical protein
LLDQVTSSWKNTTSLFFVEHLMAPSWGARSAELYPIRQNVPEYCERLANYAFAANKHHFAVRNILETVLERCTLFPQPVFDPDYYVLFTTGPSALTRAVQPLRDGSGPQDLLVVDNLLANTIIYHEATGTWRNNKDATSSFT